MISEIAPAKINLTLEILKKRNDGYHEINTIMQTIDICDILTFWENEWLKIIPEYKNLPSRDSLPFYDGHNYLNNNLVYKTALLLQKETGFKGGAAIQLNKTIPSSAGLGGGSSDAAAALRGLNRLWKLKLSNMELAEIGAKIGSDVPFFIYGGTCLATGRGEIIERLKPINEMWVAIVLLPISLEEKTKMLYSFITPQNFTEGIYTRNLIELIKSGKGDGPGNGNGRVLGLNSRGNGNNGGHNDSDNGCNGKFRFGNWASNYCNDYLFNVFESVYYNNYVDFKQWVDSLQKICKSRLNLAGSGPAVYYISDSEAEIRDAIIEIDHTIDFIKYIAKTVP